MIIIDSGSTKSDWCVTDRYGKQHYWGMSGINPTLMNTCQQVEILQEALHQINQITTLPQQTSIYFYGAGCTPHAAPNIAEAWLQASGRRDDNIEVYSDLLGAAHALCGDTAGIACILGTGSNSCLYDGEKIVANTPALGFILGDEGSGAVMGKTLVNAVFKGKLSKNTTQHFIQSTQLTQEKLIDSVYRQKMPNKFLASFTHYLADNIDNPELEQIVLNGFESFIRTNLHPYQRKDLPVNAVGSIAYVFQTQWIKSLEANHYFVGEILQRPIEALVHYRLAKE